MISSFRPREEVLIFTRYPRPGEVKSRLIPKIGETGAARTFQWMAERIMATAQSFARTRPVHCIACYTGASRREMSDWLGVEFPLYEQQGSCLGERMAEAFRSSWARGALRSVLVGSDCPFIDPPLLADAFAGLQTHDLVLGPSSDGGYYLIGLHRNVAPDKLASLFDGMKWGTGSVLRQTLDRARDNRLSFSLLKELHDIDRPEDLRYLHYHTDPPRGELP